MAASMEGRPELAMHMTLRDYFAARAMHSVWKDIPDGVNRTDALLCLGQWSYEMADAMLKARES